MTLTTLDVIARHAGVSKSTVSRVLNQSDRVAPELAKQVQESIAQHGFHARHRRRGRSKDRTETRNDSILFLLAGRQARPNTTSPLMRGVELATHEAGLSMIVASADMDGRTPVAIDKQQVDGVLLFGKSEDLTPTLRAKLSSLPVVALMRGFDDMRGEVDRVLYDNSAIGGMAADYLHRRNHRRVGYFNVEPHHAAYQVRQRDFFAASTEKSMTVEPFIFDHTPASPMEYQAGIESLVDRMRQLPDPVTALFVAGASQVAGLYQALYARGIRVGKDLDIVMSSDSDPQHLLGVDPVPAAVDINLEQVGYRSVHQLLWRLAHPKDTNRITILVEPRLVLSTELK